VLKAMGGAINKTGMSFVLLWWRGAESFTRIVFFFLFCRLLSPSLIVSLHSLTQ
jgi:hypothetical protein